jgi:hypothetical protein
LFQELEILGDLVQNKLNPLKGITESPEVLEEWFAVIQIEELKVKSKIAEIVLKLPNETHIEIFVHNYQRRLTTLADKLYTYQNFNEISFDFPNDNPINISKLQSATYQTIEDLIDYFQVHFGKFFLFDERPPRRKVLIAVMQFTQSITDIQSLVNEPNVFLNFVISAFSDFIHNPEKITYRKIDYLHKLAQEILSFNQQCIENDFTIFIKYKLFYMNFNSVPFAIVLTTEYDKEQKTLTSLTEKIEKLSWYLKRITQVPVQNDFTYNPKHKSLKDHVIHWLIEELDFLEKLHVLSNLNDQELNNNTVAVFKILTDLSVPQLAYFLRILVETEVIKNSNDKELLKFYAKHTKTKRTETISSESLRVKFYNIEDSTKEEVKSIIIKLLNFIQNNKSCLLLLNTSLFQFSHTINSISVSYLLN